MKKKVINKKTTIVSVFALLILGICIFINNAFFKPTKLNAFIAAKIYKSPANVAFTDDAFYKCIVEAYNHEHNDGTDISYSYNMTTEQLQTIDKLECHKYRNHGDITNINGVEKLTNLKSLILSDHKIETVNLNQNLKLEYLDLSDNNISEIDVSNNKNLIHLDLELNKINDIDVSNNTNLKHLNLRANNISEIDVSNNKILEYLKINPRQDISDANKLNSIDVTKNINLKTLDLFGNNLSEIDISNNTLLESFIFDSETITNIDITHLINLSELFLQTENLESINISNNLNLTKLNLYSSKINTLDLSRHTLLEDITILGYDTGFSTININGISNLKNLHLSSVMINNIDLDTNVNLENLYISSDFLQNVDLSNNNNLKELSLYGSSNANITSLDISKLALLEDLRLYYLPINDIDVSNNLNLRTIAISDNSYIKVLDVSNNLNLENFSVSLVNNLEILKFGENSKLKYITLNDSKVKQINLNGCKVLESLRVNNNELQELDISDNLTLKSLNISNNNLNDIDISNNLKLEELNVSNIDNLDLSTYSNIKKLTAGYNKEINVYKEETTEFKIEAMNELITLPSSMTYSSTFLHGWDLYSDSGCSDDSDKCTFKNPGHYTVDAIYYLNSPITYFTSMIRTTYDYYVGRLTSSYYEVDEENSYIDLGSDVISKNILNKMNCGAGANIKCDLEIEGTKLKVMLNDELIKTFDLETTQKGFDIMDDNNIIHNNDYLYIYKNTTDTITKQLITANIDDASEFEVKIYNSGDVTDNFDIQISKIEDNKFSLEIKDKTNYFDEVDSDYGIHVYVGELHKYFYLKILEPTLVTDINISDITLGINGTPQNIEYIIIPENATNKELTFEIQDETIAKLDSNNKIYGIKEGSTTLTLTATDGSNIKKTVNVNVYDFGIKSENYDVSKPNIINKIGNNTSIDNFKSNIISNSLITTKIYKDNIEVGVSTKIATGQILKTYFSDELLSEYKLIVSGDINGDGQANASDILKMKMHILGKNILEDIIFTAGDIDENNSVNATDIIYLKRYILGKTDNVWGS